MQMPQNLKELLKNTEFEKYLFPADLTKRRCVDDRRTNPQTYGPQIQGATWGEVDALKQIRHVSEEQAWEAVIKAGIPHDGHVHCGYNNKVETDPGSVGATESVSEESRLQKVMSAKGTVLHYIGDHAPAAATINFISGKTLDTNKILSAGIGTFNLDIWVLEQDAQKLGLTPEEAAGFIDHIVASYKKTVKALTHNTIKTFVELRPSKV
jgi:hypothetical protein